MNDLLGLYLLWHSLLAVIARRDTVGTPCVTHLPRQSLFMNDLLGLYLLWQSPGRYR
jgi:hypothetical protein